MLACCVEAKGSAHSHNGGYASAKKWQSRIRELCQFARVFRAGTPNRLCSLWSLGAGWVINQTATIHGSTDGPDVLCRRRIDVRVTKTRTRPTAQHHVWGLDVDRLDSKQQQTGTTAWDQVAWATSWHQIVTITSSNNNTVIDRKTA
ncbi:hypothetical protein OPV22_002240 [Ensete ventricosum]|uniref:Uncharacterized protein n=1 Tax=Ensete ventricosum TaxID=4639 RepID=A0AAV8RXG7_ENSVE|nr:hypothetical protein OPV22_002240 [Ensete ventricosum]